MLRKRLSLVLAAACLLSGSGCVYFRPEVPYSYSSEPPDPPKGYYWDSPPWPLANAIASSLNGVAHSK
jgi:hypothetical protein